MNSHEELMDAMLVLYAKIHELKPGDRSPLDRAYAITASKMEDVISNHFTWVINRIDAVPVDSATKDGE